MEEWIDVVDVKGEPTGVSCLKSKAHQKGILHASVHVWLYNKNQEILVQKRSKQKDIYPNLWDVSVAGHIATKENHLYSAQREVLEEIGLVLEPEEMDYHGIWEEKHQHDNGLIDHEIHHIYTAVYKGKASDLKLQQEEVQDAKLVLLKDFISNCSDQQTYVPHHHTYYNHIVQLLNKIMIHEK